MLAVLTFKAFAAAVKVALAAVVVGEAVGTVRLVVVVRSGGGGF